VRRQRRARLSPRPISQPWLNEAVSTAEWTGTPLANLLDEAGLAPGIVELVFTGADHGVEKGYEHDYARSLSVNDAKHPEVLLVYEMNGRPLEPQHGFPLRLIVPGWYGMTQVKWLSRIDAVSAGFDGYQPKFVMEALNSLNFEVWCEGSIVFAIGACENGV